MVGLVGGALAFASNALSSRGLNLTRNYFPGASQPASAASLTAGPAATISPAQTNQTQGGEAAARLREKGLQVVDYDRALALFHDPQYEQGLIVFIDARNDEEFKKGHIPGAYLFDRIYAEKYLGVVLPACTVAQQIVVYCHGGDQCELSEFAAEFLRTAGVPNQKLFIYTGGINEWEAHHLPIETGERKSGQFRTASQ